MVSQREKLKLEKADSEKTERYKGDFIHAAQMKSLGVSFNDNHR